MGADSAAWLGQDILAPAVDALTTDALGQEVGEMNRQRESRLLALQKQQRMVRARQENLRVLAERFPDLYNQVASGRRMPKGAVVFGGRPDQGALDQVATMMASGTL